MSTDFQYVLSTFCGYHMLKQWLRVSIFEYCYDNDDDDFAKEKPESANIDTGLFHASGIPKHAAGCRRHLVSSGQTKLRAGHL